MIGIILAAGDSRRFKTEKSKVVYQFKGKELIKYVVDAMISFVNKIVVVVGENSKDIKNVLKNYQNITYIKQKNPLGTGHALLATESLLKNEKGDLLISYADKPLVTKETFRKLIKKSQETNADLVVATAILEEPLKKGRILRKNGKLVGNIEYKDATKEQRKIKEINAGFLYVKPKKLFNELKKINNNNSAKEYYLTDLYEGYIKNGLNVKTVLIEGEDSFDVNMIEHLKLIKPSKV